MTSKIFHGFNSQQPRIRHHNTLLLLCTATLYTPGWAVGGYFYPSCPQDRDKWMVLQYILYSNNLVKAKVKSARYLQLVKGQAQFVNCMS